MMRIFPYFLLLIVIISIGCQPIVVDSLENKNNSNYNENIITDFSGDLDKYVDKEVTIAGKLKIYDIPPYDLPHYALEDRNDYEIYFSSYDARQNLYRDESYVVKGVLKKHYDSLWEKYTGYYYVETNVPIVKQ